MINGTTQMGRIHHLDNRTTQVIYKEKPIERVFSFKLLGLLICKKFDWTKQMWCFSLLGTIWTI